MRRNHGDFSIKTIQYIRDIEHKAEKELLHYQWTYATVIFLLGVVCIGITLAI
jgi:hypothetical protein